MWNGFGGRLFKPFRERQSLQPAGPSSASSCAWAALGWMNIDGWVFGPSFEDTFGGRAASYRHHVVLPPTAAMRTPSPQVLLLSLNVLTPQSVNFSEVKVRLYALLSAPLSAKCVQQFLYALGFLCPYSAVRSALFTELVLPGVELQHLIWAHFFLVTESGSNTALALPTDSVSAGRWNNVFVLLLFTAAARIHNRLSSAFLQHFSNQSNILQHFVYTVHIFLVYCNRNFPRIERPMQQNGSWKWWQIWLGKTGVQIWELVVIKYTLPSARAATCKSLTTWRRNSYQQWGKKHRCLAWTRFDDYKSKVYRPN